MNEKAVIELVRKEKARAGGVRALAREHIPSVQYRVMRRSSKRDATLVEDRLLRH